MSGTFIISQGGIGDALLGLAVSYRNGKCRILHASNSIPTQGLIARMFRAFGVPKFDVLPRHFSKEEHCILRLSPNCVQPTCLPDDLDFEDWANFGKYQRRVITELPVQELFGKLPKNDRKMVVVAPTGSNFPRTISTPFGELTKERFISKEEFVAVVKLLLADCTVYATGSPEDRNRFGIIPDPNFFWMTFDDLVCGDGSKWDIDIKDLFAIINGSDLVVSADTWVKTYSCMAKVPTIVTRTRYGGQYRDFQAVRDWGENIFLRPEIWDLKIIEVEELISSTRLRDMLGL